MRRAAWIGIGCVTAALAARGPAVAEPAGRLGGGLDRIAVLASRRGPLDPAVSREIEHLGRHFQIDERSVPPRIFARIVYDREDSAPLRAAGASVRARVGPVVSAAIPVDALDRVARVPGVRTVLPARRYSLQMDVSRPETGGSAAADRLRLTGSGTLIAVVDTGIDWENLDFRNADASTRIAAIWDQTDSSGAPPPGFTFGTLYVRAEIDGALALLRPPLVTRDGHGHGTHVAGTAAGNGRATGNGYPAEVYTGLAPEADLLIVRVFDDGAAFCGECDLTAALDWIDEQAAAVGRPCVVNMSLGDDYGPHDGTTPDEIAVDAFTGPGRAVVVAAGNSRGRGIHTEGDVFTGGTATRSFTIPAYLPAAGGGDGVFLDLWHDPADTLVVRLGSPSGFTLEHASGDGTSLLDTPEGRLRIDDRIDPVLGRGDREVLISVSDEGGASPSPGTWTLEVEGAAVPGSGHFDVWRFDASLGGQIPSPWSVNVVEELVTAPATAEKAITAGAYMSRNCWPSLAFPDCYFGAPPVGEIAWFSSPGPSRDDPGRDLGGRIVLLKPDLAAPGAAVVSSLSSPVTPDPSITHPDGVHWRLQGTSMASPHVAGAAALLFQANPALDGDGIGAFLRDNARVDAFAEPGRDWGRGKLDVEAAADDLLNLIADLGYDSGTGAFSATGSPDATTFNVYRGLLAALDGDFYGTCFLAGLPAPMFQDPTPDPAAGQGYFYLMTAVEGEIEGGLGQRSDGSLRPNQTPCG